MTDKSKFKVLRIEAKKRWWSKRVEAKRLKHIVEQAASEKSPVAVGEAREPNPAAALIQPDKPLMSHPLE